MPKGLLPVGAAAASALGGLFASDDAEAMPVAKFVKGVQHPYAQLRKLVAKNKQNGISPERTVTDWIHKNTNYEHIGKTSRAVEGAGGEHYKTQLQGIYDMLLDGIEPDKVDKDLMDGLNLWRDGRIGRDSSYTMPHAVAAAAAVAGSGAASAGEEPLLGPGIPSAFGPKEEVSTSAERGFTPSPVYDPTPVTQRNQDVMFGGPMGALGGSFSGGAAEYGIVADGTMQSMQAGGRLLFGLMSGEGWDGATNSAGKVINQGVDATQQQFGDYIEDKTGDEVLGSWAKWLPYALSPL